MERNIGSMTPEERADTCLARLKWSREGVKVSEERLKGGRIAVTAKRKDMERKVVISGRGEIESISTKVLPETGVLDIRGLSPR